MAEIDAGVLTSLAEKIDGLDLTDAEQAALDQLLARAEAYEPEVEGFGMSMDYSGFKSGADLSATAFKLGSGLGMIGRGPFTFDPNYPDDRKPPPP